MRFLKYVWMFLCAFSLQAIEEQLRLSADCEPLMAVANCVNIFSGHFFQIDKDIEDASCDPLHLTLFYDSGQKTSSCFGIGFGCQFALYATSPKNDEGINYAMIQERDGFYLPYIGKSHHYFINPKILEKGYTNCSRSPANFANFEATFKQGCWHVKLGNGIERFYTKNGYLAKEIKPNGNMTFFHYDQTRLVNVKTYNRSKTIKLSELNITYFPDRSEVISQSGEKAIYKQHTGIRHVNSTQGVATTYQMSVIDQVGNQSSSLITRIKRPEGHFLEIEYDKKERVKALNGPWNEEKITLYQFDYHHRHTDVRDTLGQLAVYRFGSKDRLNAIDYYDGDKLMKRERFLWSSLAGEEGWLKAKFVCSNEDTFCHGTLFDYDSRGNIIHKTLCGNLTGEGAKECFTFNEPTERYTLSFAYSQDNLLLSETTPEGLTTTYDYLPGTNLVTQKLLSYNGKIQERTFHFYDENGQIYQTIEDDGNGSFADDFQDVCVRKITTITSQANFPFKPEYIVEEYLQGGVVLLLKKTQLIYDERGREVERLIFDANGKHCYTFFKQWDEKNRLLSESNALGEVTCYKYDANNNKVREELIGSGKVTSFVYDRSNRLTEVREIHGEQVFTILNHYNRLGRLVSSCDSYGQYTEYTYDRLGRLIKCVKPAMKDSLGKVICPTCSYSYNILDQRISESNENGYVTTRTYNAYGKATSITYPNGAIERLTYYPNGWLRSTCDPLGCQVHYLYDAKGHITYKTTSDAAGAILKQEEYRYKGDLLTYKKDGMGVITTYTYDGAGRKIEEKTGPKVKAFVYDALGRLSKIQQEEKCELFYYDFLDRLIGKEVTNTEGLLYAKESYAYDIQGNIIYKAYLYGLEEIAFHKIVYNSRGELIEEVNPVGAKTTYSYEYDYVNTLQQKVRRITKKDALRRVLIQEEDAYGRPVRRVLIKDEQPIFDEEMAYDAMGHKTLLKKNQKYALSWAYNSLGLVETKSEWPSLYVTSYLYDAKGRLIKKKKPSAVEIYHTYDLLDRLTSIYSSDGTVSYVFGYDLHDNLIYTLNNLCHLWQTRTYDLWGRLLVEEIYPGICLKFRYDSLDRPLEVNLPDGSSIDYDYDAYHLRKITRYNALKEPTYQIKNFSYNLMGQILAYETPLGPFIRSYDLMGRRVKTVAPNWQEELLQFDLAGNLLEASLKDQEGECKSYYTYDACDQLLTETGVESNTYLFDSLYNPIAKNEQLITVNASNQVTHDGVDAYTYDLDGNLISKPGVCYTYDALDRLIRIHEGSKTSTFLYDGLGRCIQYQEGNLSKHFIYQEGYEIGCLEGALLKEFRCIHPKTHETLSIELAGKPYICMQDHRFNICAVDDETYRFSAFGKEKWIKPPLNPWRFFGKRAFGSLIYFGKRFYDPQLGRFTSPDPLESSLNLYAYVKNNPFSYIDPDGQFAIAISMPIIFETTGVVLGLPAFPVFIAAVTAATLAWGVYQLATYADQRLEDHCLYSEAQEEQIEEKKKKRDNEIRGGPPRDQAGNYLPDSLAEGSIHTTIGTRKAKYGSYTQGATFDEKGNFKRRTDLTNHGRYDHPNPHYHDAWRQDAADGPAMAIPEEGVF